MFLFGTMNTNIQWWYILRKPWTYELCQNLKDNQCIRGCLLDSPFMIWPEKWFCMGRVFEDTNDHVNGPVPFVLTMYVVPFANAGSMKYTLSLFLLCAFNPLRGIKCSYLFIIYSLVWRSWSEFVKYLQNHASNKNASSTLKLKKRC